MTTRLGVAPPSVVFWSQKGNVVPTTGDRSGLSRGVRIAHFTVETLRTPEALARAIQEIGHTIRDVGAHAVQNPFGSSILVRNITVTAGAQVIVQHGLGRMVTTWTLCRPRPLLGVVPANGIALIEMNPQPSNLDPTRQLAVISNVSGTVDILFA